MYDSHSIIAWIVIGGVAGWLAGLLVSGTGFGIIGDIVVGIIGSVIAGYVLPALHIGLGTGLIGAIVDAVIGAVILLVVVRLIRRAM